MSKTGETENLKTVKITNKKQFERLVEYLEKNEDLAIWYFKTGGDVKCQIKSRWQELSVELNALGPPTRTPDGWMKVWADLKFKVRKKMVYNKAEMRATGGGRNKLHIISPLEEGVINLLDLENLVNPSGREFGASKNQPSTSQRKYTTSHLQNISKTRNFEEVNSQPSIPCLQNSSEQTFEDHMDVDISQYEVLAEYSIEVDNTATANDSTLSGKKSSPPNRVNRLKEKNSNTTNVLEMERLKMIEKQTNIQENLYKEIKGALDEMNNSIKSTLSYTKKLYYVHQDNLEVQKEMLELKKQKVNAYKQELLLKQEARVSQIRLKTEKLELKKN